MSGGAFDYSNHDLNYLAEQVQDIVDSEEYIELLNDKSSKTEVLKVLESTVKSIKELAIIIKVIDYFVSGDYSEEDLLDQARKCNLKE